MTPREKGRGDIQSSKRGKVRVHKLRWKDASGKDCRKTLLHITRAEAQHWLSERIRERDLIESGRASLVGLKRPWREPLDEYLAAKAPDFAPKHHKRVSVEVPELLIAIGAQTLGDITAPKVRKWRDGFAKTRSNATANKRTSKLSAFLSWCVEEEILDRNVLRGMRRKKEKAVRPPRVLEEHEIARLFDVADRLDQQATDFRLAKKTIGGRTKGSGWETRERRTPFPRFLTLAFILKTGTRWGAARQVTWADVNLTASELTIRPETVKTGFGRTLPIDPELAALLEECRSAAVEVTGRIPRAQDTVLLSPLGKPWGENGGRNFLQWLYRALEAAGIPRVDEHGERIHVHALRHTFATRLIRKGVPLAKVQYLGGWKTTEMLMRIYIHLKASDALDDVAAVPLPARESVSVNNVASSSPRANPAALAAARKLLEDNGYKVVGVMGLEPTTHSTQRGSEESSEGDDEVGQRRSGGVK